MTHMLSDQRFAFLDRIGYVAGAGEIIRVKRDQWATSALRRHNSDLGKLLVQIGTGVFPLRFTHAFLSALPCASVSSPFALRGACVE